MPDTDDKRSSEEQQRGNAKGSTQGPGQPSPGLKDKDAETSDSYGDTRESGEEPK